MKPERITFIALVLLLEIFCIAMLVLVLVWSHLFLAGFAWDETGKEFDNHPMFMLISMIILNSQAMIIFRVFSKESKPIVKWVHMTIQTIAFVFGVVGLNAAFDFHNSMGLNNVYSLHSWIGMVAFVLFTCQLVCGFLGFLYPVFPDGLRATYLKVHVFFGTGIFLLAVSAVLTGITEKALFTISATYGNLPPVAIVINLLGIVVVLHAGITYFLVTNEKFKHTVQSEEHIELLAQALAAD